MPAIFPLSLREEEECLFLEDSGAGGPGVYPLLLPSWKIFLTAIAILFMVALSIFDHSIKPVYMQVLVDFFYILPVVLAAFVSLPEGLLFAAITAALIVFAAPAKLQPKEGERYLYFFTLWFGYSFLALLVNRLKETAVQRQRLERTLKLTTAAFLSALDLKDRYVGRHSRAVAGYALAIAKGMGLGRAEQELIFLSGLIHDLGKIGASDAVLLKPGPLNREEWLEIKKHPIQGYGIVKKTTGCEDLARAVLYHHERCDGKGYPAGLKGEDIPLYARILCVADSYEAVTAGRVYRPALSKEDAIAELRRCSGSQFDPRVVEIFCRCLNNGSGG